MEQQDPLVSRLRAAGCVFAEDEARQLRHAGLTPGELEAVVARRVAGEPLEHLLGQVFFAGLTLRVAPGVFVPRRRTETLAHEAARLLAAGDVMVELCCGCGPVAAVVAAGVPGVEVHACDLDPVALRCARANLPAQARVHAGDLYAALPATLRHRVRVIAANAPYVPTSALPLMPPEARRYEPRAALDGGPQGTSVLGRVVAGAGEWLARDGLLLVESGREQAPVVSAFMERRDLTVRTVHDDVRGATVVIGGQGTG